MDEGLKDRVDKVFGSISSSSSWSLSGQVERREWKRGDRDDDQIPVFSSVDDWDIRSSIGLDSTLDNEEEEDAYDQMAQGMEKDKCLYMKDVINEPFDSRSVVDATRLKQDFNIKSIMKRKSCRDTDDEVAKPAKRVRFHSTCKNAAPPPGVARVSENVPDYLLNPSKYTRYTFDDNSDAAAAAADLELLEEEESLKPLLPKSVLFIPREKRGEEHVRPQAAAACSSTFGIVAAAAAGGGETSEEEDGDGDDVVSTKAKQVRQYRSKTHQYDDDDDEEEE